MAVGLATSIDGFSFRKFEGNPVLAPDSTGFDAFTVGPGIILKEDSCWVMYYTGGRDFAGRADFYIGMAVSQDGFTWKKYNDASTTLQPFAESDPVFMTGKEGAWDGKEAWMANISIIPGGFIMYYAGSNGKIEAIGYSESRDGIHWERYRGNPVYNEKNGMDTKYSGEIMTTTNPFFLRFDTISFLYYYFEQNAQFGNIGVATGK